MPFPVLLFSNISTTIVVLKSFDSSICRPGGSVGVFRHQRVGLNWRSRPSLFALCAKHVNASAAMGQRSCWHAFNANKAGSSPRIIDRLIVLDSSYF